MTFPSERRRARQFSSELLCDLPREPSDAITQIFST